LNSTIVWILEIKLQPSYKSKNWVIALN